MCAYTSPPGEGLSGLDREIHVYRLDLAANAPAAWPLLDAAERERASRIRHAQTQQAFVQVRAALRLLLAAQLKQAPGQIRFAAGAKGKPRLADTAPDQGLVFNVSHSGAVGLIALARDTALGVDVERSRAMAHMDGMAERCFAPAELDWWRALPEAGRGAAFFAFWCCKEAFVKATGEGIGLGLEACAVDLGAKPPRLFALPDGWGETTDWRLAEIDAGAGYCAAVCWRGPARPVRVIDCAPFVTAALNV